MRSSRIGQVAVALTLSLGVAACGSSTTSPKIANAPTGKATNPVTASKPKDKEPTKPTDKPVEAGKGADPAKITKANYDKLKLEMDEKDVRAILGPVTSEKPASNDDDPGTVCTWQVDTKVITATFRKGKLKLIDSQHLDDK